MRRLLAYHVTLVALCWLLIPCRAWAQGGTLDATFDPGGGADGDIYDMVAQPDGRILIGGSFLNYDGVQRQRIARLLSDGSLDPAFDPGTNFNAPISVINVLMNGQILVAGSFSGVAGSSISYLARLNSDGSLDSSFDGGIGGGLSHLKQLPDGRIVVAGGFEFVQGQPRHNIARLLSDGTLDTNFVAGMELNSIGGMDVFPDGRVLVSHQQFWWTVTYVVRLLANGAVDPNFSAPSVEAFVYSLARGPGDKVYVHGHIYYLGGFEVRGFVRLNASGSWDRSFNWGYGDSIAILSSYAIQSDGRLVVGGSISRLYGWPLQNIARIYAGGGPDTTYRPGLGANNVVNCVRLQPDGKALIAGPFSRIDGVARARVARLNQEGVTPAGILLFNSPSFTEAEGATNAIITVRRAAGTNGTVTVDYATANDTAIAGQDFVAVNGTLTFEPGETLKLFAVPLIDNSLFESNKTVTLTLSAPSGGASLSRETTATLVITNDDSAIEFAGSEFYANESVPAATIKLRRVGVPTGPASVDYVILGGTATAGADYLNQTGSVLFAAGQTSAEFTIPVLDDAEKEPTETVLLGLANATGQAHIGGLATATLALLDNERVGGVAADFRPASGVTGAVNAIAVRSDGRIAFGGQVNSGIYQPLGQLLPDGSLDPDFIPPWRATDFVGVVVNATAFGPADELFAGGAQSTVALFGLILRQSRSGHLSWQNPQNKGFTGGVLALAPLTDGRVLVAGSFTTLLGQSRARLAMLRRDGTLDPAFNPAAGADASILALALEADGHVLLGGAFTNVNGVIHSHIARLRPDGTLDTGFNAAADGIVYALTAQADGAIVAGGSFTQINGTPQPRLGRLLPNGLLDEQFARSAALDGDVRTLALQCDGSILVGGGFTNIFGQTSPGLARLTPDGGLDSAFDVGIGANGPVRALAVQNDGEVLVGGSFTSFDAVPAPGLVRLHGDGAGGASYFGFASTSFAASEDSGAVNLQIVRSGSLASEATLTLTVTNGSATSGADFLPPPATVAFSPGEQARNISVPLFDDCAAEGTETAGLFLTAASSSNWIVRGAATLRLWDDETAGSPERGFQADAASPPLVNALAPLPDGRWLVGGAATATRRGIARLNSDGSLDGAFETNAEPFLARFGEIAALALRPDGKIFIAGSFLRTNATSGFAGSNFLARLNSDGSWDGTFDAKLRITDQSPAPPPGILAIALQPDGRFVAAGGTPLSQGQVSRGVLARFLADGQLDTSFLAPINSLRTSPKVRAVALLPSGQILAAGAFATTGPTLRTNLVRFQTNGVVDPTFFASVGGEVISLIAFPDGGVLAGGAFSNAAFFGSNGLQRLLPSGVPDSSFVPQIDGVVYSCAILPDGRLLIGGAFSQVNGQPRAGLARLSPNGSLDPTFDPGSGADDAVTTLMPLPDGMVMAGGWFSSMNGAPARGLTLLSAGGAPLLAAPQPGAERAVSLRVSVRPGCPHVLEGSIDLNRWEAVTTNTPDTSPWVFTDPSAGGSIHRFYRVRRGDF